MARSGGRSPIPYGGRSRSGPRPSAEELQAITDPYRVWNGDVGYGIRQDEALGALRMMEGAPGVGKISPMASLPVAASQGQFGWKDYFEAIAIWEDDLENAGDLGVTAGTYYQGQQVYNNRAGQTRGEWLGDNAPDFFARSVMPGDRNDTSPAPITIVPTSTTNVVRPRTVAAGYDRVRQTLTVVFRDGTFYNYYEVHPRVWDEFKARKSKGKFIATYLDAYDRGPADVAAMPAAHREALYRITRTAQLTNRDRKKGRAGNEGARQQNRRGTWERNPSTGRKLRNPRRF